MKPLFLFFCLFLSGRKEPFAMIRFGISTACFYPEYTEAAVRELAANGVKWIEIFFNTYSELEEPQLSELELFLNEYDMKVIALHPFTSGFEPMLFFSDYYRRFQDGLRQYELYFRGAARLGAKYLVLHGNRKDGKLPDEEYFRRFKELRDYGRRFGVEVVQENVSGYKSRSLDFLKRMREFLDGDVSFVLDIKQALRSGEDVFEMLSELGENIVHIHLSDHLTGREPSAETDCLPIETGDFDFERFFDRLREIGYEGYGMLELYRHNYGKYAELYDSLDRLRKYEK